MHGRPAFLRASNSKLSLDRTVGAKSTANSSVDVVCYSAGQLLGGLAQFNQARQTHETWCDVLQSLDLVVRPQ